MSNKTRHPDPKVRANVKRRRTHDFLLFLHQLLAPFRKSLLAGQPLPWRVRILVYAFMAVVRVLLNRAERQHLKDATNPTKL